VPSRTKKELTPDDITFLKNIFLDAETFATQFPPTEDEVYRQVQVGNPSDPVDFTELESRLGSYPAFFRLYGVAVDHINAVSYNSFLHYFSEFYKKYRNAGVVEENGEFACNWETVDELVRKNKQLSGEHSYIRCYWPKESIVSITAPPKSLTQQELINRALQERYAAGLGGRE